MSKKPAQSPASPLDRVVKSHRGILKRLQTKRDTLTREYNAEHDKLTRKIVERTEIVRRLEAK